MVASDGCIGNALELWRVGPRERRLGGIDAEQADRVGGAVDEFDFDCVTVNDASNRRPAALTVAGTRLRRGWW